MPAPTLISALPIADPLDGTEDVPVVQHGITKQSKSSNFWSGGTFATTVSPAFSGTLSSYNATPFGTYNDAVAASFVSNGPNGARAEVLGLHTPSEAATYSSRDQVTLYVGQTAPAILATASGASYTATTLLPVTNLSAPVVATIQAAIVQATAEGRAVGMLIDTNHSPKYTGSITAVASDGSSVTVSAWYQMGNTSSGQVPSNGVDAYINPVTKVWNINGISTLNAGSFAKSSTFMEGDIYNNRASYVGTGTDFPGAGISMNCNANDGSYGYLALNNFYTGFLSRGNKSFGYLIQDSGGTNPGFGFVSYVNSASGHHPFAANDLGSGYYYSVTATGGLNLGNPATRNGFGVSTSASGSAPIIAAAGPDADIDIKLDPKGAGYVHAVSGLLVDGTANVGYLIGSIDAALQVGPGRSTSGNAYVNLVGDTTYTTYGTRLIRKSTGANAQSAIDHRGTGDLQFNTAEAANMTWSTSGTLRLTLSAAGNLTLAGTGSFSAPTITATTSMVAPTMIAGDSSTHAATTAFVQTALTSVVADTTLVRAYGYIGDGLTHPASSKFGTLAAAQAVYPSCLALTDEIDGLALQKALASFGTNKVTLSLPPGSIGRSSRALTTGTAAVSIMGNWSTLLFVTAGSGAWVHSSAATYGAGLHMEKLSLQCVGAGGTAITASFNAASGDLVLTDMLISGSGNQTTNYWTAILAATDASLTTINRVTGIGINGGALSSVGNGISFTATTGAYQVSIRDTTINYYNTALVISSSTRPGIEGVICNNFQANGCMIGVSHANTATDTTYWAPQFVFQNCQWNLFQQWMSFSRASEIWIVDNLIYLSAPASGTSGTSFPSKPLLYFSNCFDVTIRGNILEAGSGSRNTDVITLDNATGAVSVGDHNIFKHFGTMSGVGVRLNTGATNVKEDGTNYWGLPGGTANFLNSAGVIGTGNALNTQTVALGGSIDAGGTITYINTGSGTTDTSGTLVLSLPTGMFTGIVAAVVCNGDAGAVNAYHAAVVSCSATTLTARFLGLTSAIPARVNYMVRGY